MQLLSKKGAAVLNATVPTAPKKKTAGVASQTLCLAAHEAGLGTVIMGIWDEDGITDLLHIPEDQELAALIAIGYPDIDPDAPKRKSVNDLLTYL